MYNLRGVNIFLIYPYPILYIYIGTIYLLMHFERLLYLSYINY